MVHVMILAAGRQGLLRRVVGLYESRGYDVRALTLGEAGLPAELPPCGGMVRITLTLNESVRRAEMLARQLRRLVDVVAVEVAAPPRAVGREMALIKVAAGPGRRPEILQIAQVFRARVVDAGPRSVVLEATGDPGKIEALIALLREQGVAEIARTGPAALHRSDVTLADGRRGDPPGDAGAAAVAPDPAAAATG